MINLFPYTVWDSPWLAPCALLLDLLFGDPRLPWPHPVCFIGSFLNFLEKRVRLFIDKGKTEAKKVFRGRLAGFASLFLALLVTTGLCRLLLALPGLSWLMALYLAWAGLAMGCLLDTGKIVLDRIENASIEEARKGCAWLVSRDVSQMDRQLLRKTLADTLAENYTDAFTAPFFWLLCGGPLGLWLYKTVSTMDSQWGYLTPQWKDLGFAGAKADDALAWLPARISILLLYLTDQALRHFPRLKSWSGSFPDLKTFRSQARGMPSPNSGWSMTACAWLCQARMAGPSVYFGELIAKPWLGPAENLASSWTEKSLLALCKLLFYGAIIGGALLWLFTWLCSIPFSCPALA